MYFIVVMMGVLFALLLLSFAMSFYFFQFAIVRKNTPKKKLKAKTSRLVDVRREQRRMLVKESINWFLNQNPEQVTIKSFDGLRLRAYLLRSDKPTNRVILCIHGHHSSGLKEYAALTPFYHSLGVHLVIVDDRAHGSSEGKYIGFGCLDRLDCQFWIQYILNRFGIDIQIFLHGISMGASTVLMASGMVLPENVKGIIADCGYTSPWNEFRYLLRNDYHLPHFPILYFTNWICKCLAKYGFRDCNTVEEVQKTNIPILFIHGDRDKVVPIAMSQEAYDACASDKKLLIVPGAEHAESFFLKPEFYQQAVKDFIDSYSLSELQMIVH